MDPMDDAKTWHPLASLKFQKDGVFFSYSVHKVLQDVQYPHLWNVLGLGSWVASSSFIGRIRELGSLLNAQASFCTYLSKDARVAFPSHVAHDTSLAARL